MDTDPEQGERADEDELTRAAEPAAEGTPPRPPELQEAMEAMKESAPNVPDERPWPDIGETRGVRTND